MKFDGQHTDSINSKAPPASKVVGQAKTVFSRSVQDIANGSWAVNPSGVRREAGDSGGPVTEKSVADAFQAPPTATITKGKGGGGKASKPPKSGGKGKNK